MDSISVDRKPTQETNIRMMTFLNKDTSGRRYKEGFRMKQEDHAGRVEGHLQEGE